MILELILVISVWRATTELSIPNCNWIFWGVNVVSKILVIVIPLEDNRHYSNTELKAFSNQMNAGDKIRKNPASKDDLKKQLLTMIVDAQDESVLDHHTVKAWLVSTMYVTKKKANGLIKSAKSQYQKDKYKHK